MADLDWKRKEYTTWDEAFRALVPINRQQSVRVAEYTQILFTCACSASYCKGTAGGEYMSGKYADAAYKCGLYHQIGKALVPPEYQVYQNDFSEEELAVYRKYTTDGRALVAQLQERGAREKEKRTRSRSGETPTKNIPWLMVRESCEQHMERYDGTGYPGGKSGRQISPIAHIVGFVKELDRLSAETKLERPFDEAVKILSSQSGTAWDPELVGIFAKNVDKLRTVYEKYVLYTLTLPETIPLVVKREGRPMKLEYRPMLSDSFGTVAGYEAIPRLGGVAGQPGATESPEELEEMLKRTDIVADVSFYFLYEAADAILRLENCGIDSRGILVPMLPSFYRTGGLIQRFEKLFEDQPIPKHKLLVTFPAPMLKDATKTLTEQIVRYLKHGIALVLDGYRPSEIPETYVRELGFEFVRIPSDLYLDHDTGAVIRTLKENGVTVIASSVADSDALAWLASCGAELMSGPVTGALTDEDGIIREALTKQ